MRPTKSDDDKARDRNKSRTHEDVDQKIKPVVIIGSFIHSLSIDRLEVIDRNGLMVIDSSRKIVCFEYSHDRWTDSKLKQKLMSCLKNDLEDEDGHVDLKRAVRLISLRAGEFFLPGFVDTHTHAVQYQNIGIGQQYELLDWLKHVTFAEEMRFQDNAYAQRMFEKVVNRLIRVGTTTCCYYSSIHLGAAKVLAKICQHAGQRAFIGKCNMDRNDSVNQYKETSAEQSINDTIDFITFLQNGYQSSSHSSSTPELGEIPTEQCCTTKPFSEDPAAISCMVQPILTPRFAISCTDQLLSSLGSLMKMNDKLLLQTHLSESLAEIEFTKKLYPNRTSYSDVYDSFGLLGQRTVLAHCIHLESSELKLLMERNCGLSHCPTSNFNLSSGICQIQTLLKSGFEKIGLGTDVSGGYGVGILTTIRDAAFAAKMLGFGKQDENNVSCSKRQLSIENLLYMATLGGAKVCNLDDRIGNFEVGKEFDGLLIQTGAGSNLLKTKDVNDRSDIDGFSEWLFSSQSLPYQDGLNPNFFIDDQAEEIDLFKLLEKFLFTGDDRNIGSVLINTKVVGGSRPLCWSQ